MRYQGFTNSTDREPEEAAIELGRREYTPERNLWGAVIANAIQDIEKPWRYWPGVRDEQVAEKARKWFASKEVAPGTFRWICQHLADDANGFAEAILKRIEAV